MITSWRAWNTPTRGKSGSLYSGSPDPSSQGKFSHFTVLFIKQPVTRPSIIPDFSWNPGLRGSAGANRSCCRVIRSLLVMERCTKIVRWICEACILPSTRWQQAPKMLQSSAGWDQPAPRATAADKRPTVCKHCVAMCRFNSNASHRSAHPPSQVAGGRHREGCNRLDGTTSAPRSF